MFAFESTSNRGSNIMEHESEVQPNLGLQELGQTEFGKNYQGHCRVCI